MPGIETIDQFLRIQTKSFDYTSIKLFVRSIQDVSTSMETEKSLYDKSPVSRSRRRNESIYHDMDPCFNGQGIRMRGWRQGSGGRGIEKAWDQSSGELISRINKHNYRILAFGHSSILSDQETRCTIPLQFLGRAHF